MTAARRFSYHDIALFTPDMAKIGGTSADVGHGSNTLPGCLAMHDCKPCCTSMLTSVLSCSMHATTSALVGAVWGHSVWGHSVLFTHAQLVFCM